MLIVIAGVAIWLVSSVLSAGIYFAYFQGRFPPLAAKDRRRDCIGAWSYGLVFGPVGLLVALPASGFCAYGWRL